MPLFAKLAFLNHKMSYKIKRLNKHNERGVLTGLNTFNIFEVKYILFR